MRGVAEEKSPEDAGIARYIDERETYEPQVVSAVVWFGLAIAAAAGHNRAPPGHHP
jgi:hypothetical protein